MPNHLRSSVSFMDTTYTIPDRQKEIRTGYTPVISNPHYNMKKFLFMKQIIH